MKSERLAHEAARTWQRVIEFAEPLSAAAAKGFLKVRLSKRDQEQMNALSVKARAGALTPQEQADLNNYERLGCLLDVLHSKARVALKRRRTTT